MRNKTNKPPIQDYDDYRLYLKDLFEVFKKADTRFSHRYFSARAGLRSPNFLKLVIDGQRNISPASIDRFAEAFKLNQEERGCFRNLVNMNQATTVEDRHYYAEQIMKSRLYKKTHPLSQLQYDYYAQWYYIPIRELVSLPDFQPDPRWIASRLSPAITTKEAEEALATLEQLNLLTRDNAGRLIATDQHVTTGDEVAGSAVPQFHRVMIEKAREALDRYSSRERDISSVTAGFSPEKIMEAKRLISQFRKDLLALSNNSEEGAEIYQINFQLFPLTGKKKGPQS